MKNILVAFFFLGVFSFSVSAQTETKENNVEIHKSCEVTKEAAEHSKCESTDMKKSADDCKSKDVKKDKAKSSGCCSEASVEKKEEMNSATKEKKATTAPKKK